MEKQSVSLNLALPFLAWILEYTGISGEKLAILAILMALDMFSGVAKTYRLNKEEITSNKFVFGLVSKLTILLIPLAIGLMARGIDVDAKSFVNFCFSVLIVSEAYSVIGNIYTVKTGKKVKEIDAISAILKVIQNLFETAVNQKK